MLRSHYRSPIEVTESTIEQAERSLERLDALARRCSTPDPFNAEGVVIATSAEAAGATPTLWAS